jgi:sugar O-acyltransferase (sialic acid O-acetyltransferase NeuD family)
MKIIYTPKVGTNDIEVKLCVIHRHNVRVKPGEIICEVEIETSKVSYDIDTEYEGYVYIIHDLNKNILVGSPLAIISESQLSEVDLNLELKKLIPSIDANYSNYNITKKAQILIDRFNVDISLFKKDVITEKDVQDLLIKVKLKNDLQDFNFSTQDIVIVGIGGHAGMCIDILRQNNEFNIAGFIDDNVTHDDKYGLKYLGGLDDIEFLTKNGLCNVILGIGFVGNLKKREKVYDYLTRFVNIPSIIHEKSIIEPTAKIHNGCQIMAGAIIGSNVVIGQNCIVNSGAIVSHDSIISDSSHLTPGATLAGHVRIGKRVTVGMCSTIYIGLSISDDKVINNGKTVIENV